jgi:tRNA 2-selenouridine synthase
MSTWNDSELISLFSKKTPLVDVRSPVEFKDGSIPFSVNLPLLNNDERTAIGICYKEKGQEIAIELGHSLIHGKIKEERIKSWTDFMINNPTAEFFCFRGGLRSTISCEWIQAEGFQKMPILGGYKRLRHFFLSWLNDAPLSDFIRIGGLTGSGKTHFLNKLPCIVDLEGLAHHRGSAFGLNGEQPSQITFENSLALKLMEHHQKKIFLEDESVTIGRVTIPKRIFEAMRTSPLIILEVGYEQRLNNIFNDYVKDSTADFFLSNLKKIEKRLGSKKFHFLHHEISTAFSRPLDVIHHEGWITHLLKEYYDPLYQKDLLFNKEKIIFKGTEKEVLEFLS